MEMQNTQSSGDSKQYIVAKLGIESFGIDISYIDNIVRMQKITRIPKAQPYFKGVINLRGEVIPVMSLRLKFDLEEGEVTNATRIIIIKLESQGLIGLIVDEVKEVVTLSEDEMEKPKASKDAKANDKAKYLTAIGKHGDALISLLNINNVVIDKDN